MEIKLTQSPSTSSFLNSSKREDLTSTDFLQKPKKSILQTRQNSMHLSESVKFKDEKSKNGKLTLSNGLNTSRTSKKVRFVDDDQDQFNYDTKDINKCYSSDTNKNNAKNKKKDRISSSDEESKVLGLGKQNSSSVEVKKVKEIEQLQNDPKFIKAQETNLRARNLLKDANNKNQIIVEKAKTLWKQAFDEYEFCKVSYKTINGIKKSASIENIEQYQKGCLINAIQCCYTQNNYQEALDLKIKYELVKTPFQYLDDKFNQRIAKVYIAIHNNFTALKYLDKVQEKNTNVLKLIQRCQYAIKFEKLKTQKQTLVDSTQTQNSSMNGSQMPTDYLTPIPISNQKLDLDETQEILQNMTIIEEDDELSEKQTPSEKSNMNLKLTGLVSGSLAILTGSFLLYKYLK
eukprot:403337845